jgi:hypothetical protein
MYDTPFLPNRSFMGTYLKFGIFKLPAGLPDGRYIFRPKILTWYIFDGPLNGKCWYILYRFGIL